MSGFAAKFAGCVWTEAVTSGKKKLRIKKISDTCGQGTQLEQKPKKIRRKNTNHRLVHMGFLLLYDRLAP